MTEYVSKLGPIYYFYEKAKLGQPTLLFLPAFGGDSTYFNFKHIIDRLKHQYGILAMDSIGYGKSGTKSMDRTLKNVVSNYLEIFDHLHLDKVIIVGHSMGAIYSLALAEKIDPAYILLIEPPHIGILDSIQVENQNFLKQIDMLLPLMKKGDVTPFDFIESTNPHNDKKIRLENAKLLFSNFANTSLLTEIDHTNETISITSALSNDILVKTIVLCTKARQLEYEQSVFKNVKEIHAIEGTHYLHWSNPKEVLAKLQ